MSATGIKSQRPLPRSRSHYLTPLMESNTTQHNCVSTFFVSNLHCGSCVRNIQETLAALQPPPSSVDVSIVAQSVTVAHLKELSPSVIQAAIDEAGFDVLNPVDVDITASSLHSRPSTLSISARKLEKHIDQCSLCQKERLQDGNGAPVPVTSERRTSQDTDITVGGWNTRLPVLAAPENPEAEYKEQGPFRAVLSVGGVTCSACTNTVTHHLSEIPGVSDISVSLISKSATLTLANRDLLAKIIEVIDDAGFEVELFSIDPIQVETAKGKSDQDGPTTRTVSLRVDGMFCHHCPDKISQGIAALGPRVTVIKPITDHTDPILNLSYQPDAPSFTIRTVMHAIANSKSPPFDVSISRPPSLEERAQKMREHEQRSLLMRLAFAVIVAIPTFVIAIVFMSLVKDNNPVRTYLSEPMWAGNVARTQWALFIMATPVMFYSAGVFHRRSLKEIRSLWRPGSTTPILKRFIRFGSMNLLVSSGVSVAYFASIALLGLAAAEKRSPIGQGNSTTYFDSVIFLTMFLLAGRFLEAYSKARTADAVTALVALRPSKALVLVPKETAESTFSSEDSDFEKGGDLEKGSIQMDDDASIATGGLVLQELDVALLEVGDIVRVRSGSTPPADGVIISGEDASFDESSLTGESRLIKKDIGDEVFVGTISKGKVVDIRIKAVGGQTMLDHIVNVVREGQARRAPIERLADLLTGYFVPIVTLLAICTWIIWLALGYGGVLPRSYLDIPVGGWTVWSLEFAISVFVVACPCGIGLAAPTALLVGSGLAAKYGILARGGGEAFQEMAQVDVVVFDKTGTLTEGGEPRVSDFEVYDSDSRWNRATTLGLALEIESATSHPLAIAIRSFCEAENAPNFVGTAFEETAGRGLKANFETKNCTAIIGNELWMQEHGVTLNGRVSERLEQWKSEAKSVVLLAAGANSSTSEGQAFVILAAFAVADKVRTEAPAVISGLNKQGINTWMISGDNETTAKAVAGMVGIPSTNVIAGVLPHEKAEKILWLQQTAPKRQPSSLRKVFQTKRLNDRCIVAMVGDGINDAPALSAADIGIAIGSGSDVAISSASFILVTSDLKSLLTLASLARAVFNRVKFNFVWALVYNVVAVPIAAGVIYPAGHARLAPVWASLSMALSSVSVICSSLLLKLYRQPKV